MPPRKPRLPKGLVEKLGSLRTTTAKQGLAVKDVYLGAIRQGLSALLGSGKAGSVPFEAKRAPMNEPLSVARSFATMSLPLAEMRAVGKAFGATLNDVAATIVDEGMHRYLRQSGHPFPDRLVGMCPVSLREEGDTDPSTKASAMFVRMGAPETPVAERIGEVMASIAAGKAELRGMSKDAAMLYAIAALGLAELIDATRLKRVARPLANFVLSNVPGAAETRYLAGAPLVGSFPISALGMGVGLNVTLTSYADTMDFGFVGNGKALKDLPALARHTRDAYDELKAAAPCQGDEAGAEAARATATAPEPKRGKKSVRRSRRSPRRAQSRAASGRRDAAGSRQARSRAMERMSGADALMIYLDRAEAYNHTIKLHILDPSEDPEGWSWQRFKRTMASRVGLVPRLRQRYLRVPLGINHPVWVDDPAFDIDYHLRRVGCPAPGTDGRAVRAGLRAVRASARPHASAVADLGHRGARRRPRRASCC